MPNPDTRAVVTVTQEDTNCLADAFATAGAIETVKALRRGEACIINSRVAAQAVARSRIAAEARVSAREERLREAAAKLCDRMVASDCPGEDGKNAAWNLAIAIRALPLHTDGAGS